MATQARPLKSYSEEFEPLGGLPPSRYGPKEGWFTVVLILALVLSVVWSVEVARWVKGLPSVTLTAVIAVFTGMLLAKVKRRSIYLHPIGLSLGYLLLIWQTRDMTTDGWVIAKTANLVSRFQVWTTAAESGGISADPLPFVTIIVVIAWVISYFSSWFIFRSLRLWPVIIPTSVALFLNLLYLPDKFWFFFYLYILAALLLAMRLHFLKRQNQWHKKEVPYSRNAASSFAWTALILGSVAIFTAWLMPRTDFSPDALKRGWAFLGIPWKSMETELGRVLSFLPAQKPYTIHKFGDAFPFRGASSLGNHVVMRITSTRPSYWKAETFDVYTHKGWLTGDRTELTNEFRPEGEVVTYKAARTIEQTVRMGVSSDALFAGMNPLYSSAAFEVEIAPPMTFEIDLKGPSENDDLLPADLVPVAKAIRAEAQAGALTFTEAGALRDLPRDTVIKEIVRQGKLAVKVVLSRLPPNPPDVMALRPVEDLMPSDSYQAFSYDSSASEEALQRAGIDYPSWVTDRYLQLPDDMPERVKGLALGLANTRDNPYDKAMAIQHWLRTIYVYTTNIDPPPQEADGVDYFLFVTQRGYSSYYSSSMVVMLRSIGIPSRLAVGYGTGDWDEEAQQYVVHSSNAHSWPEAYFPEYGWIPFEPVPIEDIFVRGGAIEGDDSELPPEVVRIFEAGDPPGQARDDGGSSGEVFGALPIWLFLCLIVIPASLLLMYIAGRLWLGHGLSGLGQRAQLYGRMTRLGALGGFGPTDQRTPNEYALALATEMDVVEGHIERIGAAYAASRYSPSPATSEEKEELDTAWRSLRNTLLWWAIKRRLRMWRLRK